MITSDYGTTDGTGDVLIHFNDMAVASTNFYFDVEEMVKEVIKKIRFNLFTPEFEDNKIYKTIERPKLVEVYRRLAKPFWTGKNFKKV